MFRRRPTIPQQISLRFLNRSEEEWIETNLLPKWLELRIAYMEVHLHKQMITIQTKYLNFRVIKLPQILIPVKIGIMGRKKKHLNLSSKRWLREQLRITILILWLSSITWMFLKCKLIQQRMVLQKLPRKLILQMISSILATHHQQLLQDNLKYYLKLNQLSLKIS